MPIGQSEHHGALRMFGIEPGAHTLDLSPAKRMKGVDEAARPEVEDVVVGQGADVWPFRGQACDVVRVHAVVRGFAWRELPVGGDGGFEVEQPDVRRELVNQGQRVAPRPREVGRPGIGPLASSAYVT